MTPEFNTLRILWGAFVASHVAILVVGQVFASDGPFDAAVVGMFALLSIPSAIGGLFVLPLTMRQAPMLQVSLIRFAMFESVALFGLVASVAGSAPGAGLGLGVFALLLHLSLFPTEERYTAWEIGRADADGQQPGPRADD